ncbi:hypothetical protein, partial [Phocaeicola vulgatus]|uniref:hypothetical protein n=1 Tax=Phocaeicola vulgatus TaxID=821 RepID=UPI001C7060BB
NSSCSDWLGYTLKRKITNQENPLTLNWGAVEISFSRLNLFIRIPSISISFGVNSKDLRR